MGTSGMATAKRRRQQAVAIRLWRPWEHSTGPRTAAGKARSARNADRGGEWCLQRELLKALNGAMRAQWQALRAFNDP
jgi:hypothetical protein